MIRPPALRLGDTVGIIAPAGPIQDRNAFDLGVATLRRLGFQVRYDDRIFESYGYLAGRDAARSEELMRYFEDPAIDAVLSVRGGYGCSRLIPLLDENRLRAGCKLFMGFSDVTTLHLFFQKKLGWISLHGPMVTSAALGSLQGGPETHLLGLWMNPEYRPRLSFPELVPYADGAAEGRLTGGCLSLVTASLGTPYEVETEGAILFLEDLGEPPYRIDRMLTQLQLAGKFERLSGIVLGSFLDCDNQGASTAEETLIERLHGLQIPVLGHFPAGHGNPNWVLPMGSRVRLDTAARSLEILEPAVT